MGSAKSDFYGDKVMAFINFSEIDHSDIVIEQNVSGDLADYDLSGFERDKFRKQLISGYFGEPDGPVSPPSSVRQMFEICDRNPRDTEINDGVTVNDILCSRKTSSTYNTRFTGTRLIEGRYADCEPESQTIDFAYPYTDEETSDRNFTAKIFISNPNVYNTVIRMLYKYTGPILVYAYWRPVGMELLGTVDSEDQIAVM